MGRRQYPRRNFDRVWRAIRIQRADLELAFKEAEGLGLGMAVEGWGTAARGDDDL